MDKDNFSFFIGDSSVEMTSGFLTINDIGHIKDQGHDVLYEMAIRLAYDNGIIALTDEECPTLSWQVGAEQ